MNKTINIITSTLPPVHGGRTSSLLRRARLFSKEGKKINIYTTNYNEEYEQVYKKFRQSNKINESINPVNIYDYYRGSMRGKRNNYLKLIKTEIKGNRDDVKRSANSNLIYSYQEGRIVMHVSHHKKSGEVKNVDFYSPNYKRSVKRAYVNSNGNVHKIRYFEAGTDKINTDVFVNVNLKPYAAKEYSYDDNKKLIVDRVILFDKKDDTKVFSTEAAFFEHWFSELFKPGDTIINDARLLDKSILNLDTNITKILQLHGSHLSEPTNLDSNVKKSFKVAFEGKWGENDKIVTLTEGQKKNIIARHPHLDGKVEVIPHARNTVAIKNKVKDKTIVIIARLAPEKRIDHAIIAFSEFSKVNPAYKLNIYGEGLHEVDLKKIVSKLNLNETINFKGVTKNPDEIFQEADFSLMCSTAEGFALTVLESITNGCPVISYDLYWGPSEILDANSGRLTKKSTPQSLCEEMLQEVVTPHNRNLTRKRSNKFSEEKFVSNWFSIIE